MTTHTSSLNAASPSGIANAWLLRERVQPSTSWPKSTRFTLKTFQGYLLSDTQKIGLQASLWTDDKSKAQIYYDLDYHRAMQEAYQRQNPHSSIPIYVQPHDYKLFLDYCTRHNLTASAAFHTLLNLT